MNSQIVKFLSVWKGDMMAFYHGDHVGHDMGTGAVMKGHDENRADMESWT